MRRREDDYRGRERRSYREEREDKLRLRSRSRSRSKSRTRRRSKSPRRDDRRTHRTSYRDLDRPEPEKLTIENEKTTRVDEKFIEKSAKVVASTLAEEVLEEGDEDAQLAAFLGITGFASTKGQKVRGNEFNEAVDTAKKRREYRQYLFVKGAYDIPLTKEQLEAKAKEKNANNNNNFLNE